MPTKKSNPIRSTKSRPRQTSSKIRPVGDDAYINIGVFGYPGVGKSLFAGTSPKALILANKANESVSMKKAGSKAEMWVCPDITELTEAYEYVRHEGVRKYDWVWIDNTTLLQDQNMDMIMEDLIASKPHRDKYIPDKAEYLRNQNMLSLLVRNFTALPINFGFTAHVMHTEDGEGNMVSLPMIQGGQGALSQKLCGCMNIVMFLGMSEKVKGRRIGWFQPHDTHYSKDRFGVLGNSMVDPTIPKIQALLKKGAA